MMARPMTVADGWDPWSYTGGTWQGESLIGFSVEALDGEIGKVDHATDQARADYIVVDTGPWIFGRRVLLPAAVIRGADLEGQRVFVNRTRDQIRSAPEFDQSRPNDASYREQVGSYYAASYHDRAEPG